MDIGLIEDLNLRMEVDYIDMINYPLAHNDFSLIKDIYLINQSKIESINNINIRIYSNSKFIFDYEKNIPNISNDNHLTIPAPKVEFNYDFFRGVSERIKTHFFIEIKNENEEVIFNKAYKINIMPFQHWLGTNIYPQLTAAYIVPNDQEVKRIVSQAGEKLKTWTGSPSFDGYQSNQAENVRMQAAAIYASLQKENIAYKNPPASFERFGQNIRYPQEIIQYKNGTCLDLAFLLAACLEAVGINPLVIFINEHAFVGFWLQDKNFTESCVNDYTSLTKRFSKGIHEIELIEATSLVNGKNYSFEEAVQLGHQNLDTSYTFDCVIDVVTARHLGFNPVITKDQQTEFVMTGYGQNEITTEAPTTIFEQHSNIEYKINPLEKTDIWSRNLLDLTLRNSLVNFKINKNALQLMVYDVATLEDELATSNKFKIIEKPENLTNAETDYNFYNAYTIKNTYKSMIDGDFKDGRIRSFLTKYMLNKQLKTLYRKAKSDLDENGSSSLFIAIGFLSWSGGNHKKQLAPLVLLPLSIERKSASSSFQLELSEEEPQFNVTLVEYLRQNFNIDLRHLINLPTDDKGIDIPRLFTAIRKAIMDKEGWDIEEIAFISNFSFKKFVMWNDLQTRKEEIVSNPNVNALISGNYKLDRNLEGLDARKIEQEIKPINLNVGSLVDASQLEAVKASEQSSFVLHGPPGTGKSQTITNMIIHNLNKGKKILFVAEKQAALNVVNDRLSKLGLEDVLLELHSNKTKKTKFLNKIEHSLSLKQEYEQPNVVEKSNNLFDLKNKLSQYVNVLHKKQDTGLSIYELIQKHEKYSDIENEMSLDINVVKNFNNIDIEQIKDISIIIDNTKCQLKNEFGNHPYKMFDICNYSISKRDKLIDITNQLIKNLENAKKQIADIELEEDSIIETVGEVLDFAQYLDVAKKYEGRNRLNLKIVNSSNQVSLKDAFDFAHSTLTTYLNAKNNILAKYKEKILNINASFLLSEWQQTKNKVGLFKNRRIKQLLNNLNEELINNKELNEKEFENDLKVIIDFQNAREILQKRNDNFIESFGETWQGKFTDLNELERQVLFIDNNKLYQVSTKEQHLYLNLLEKKVMEPTVFNNLKVSIQNIKDLTSELLEIYKINNNFLMNIKINELPNMAAKWHRNISDLKNWSLINSNFSALSALLKTDIRKQYLKFEREIKLKDVIMKEIVEKLIRHYFIENELLDSFNGFEIEENIKFLKEKVAEFNEITIERTKQVISDNLKSKRNNIDYEDEFLFLQKAIRSKGRGQSIRNIFNHTSNIAQDIFPIMLMSPLSIAQYIDPRFPKFDLIIFDEASQIPTDIAVGAVSRAKNCVVVGDPKQMPPTSFFGSNNIDENNIEMEDLESLLDDCLAANFPEKHLKWHYRSQHESLIHYSNRTYYNSSLYTYPSTDTLESKVQFKNVHGIYERGNGRINKEEGNYIVKNLMKHLKSTSEDSIGVITFNMQQQELIDNLLEQELINYPDLDIKNLNAKESIFIKNLENVQGDERDIILFSTTFGPDEERKFTMNFGPLNSEGGWRRLNVAITRARKQMHIITSFDPEEIDLSRTKSEGVKGLKGFLEYARNPEVLPAVLKNSFDEEHGIVEVLKNELAKHGYESQIDVGNSDFKIDLAIVNPKNKDKYLLGILIDGKNYYNAQTAIDRNLIQPEVLKNLGWKIERIWSVDWYEDSERLIQKIINKIEKMMEEVKNEEKS